VQTIHYHAIIVEAMRESWTDERLDHFRARVDERFEEVGRRLGRVEFEMREMRAEMREMNKALTGMQRSMLQGAIALSAAMIASFGGMAGLIAFVA
jgi:hypothetical protein